MFGKNKRVIFETLKADMEESIRMWKMAQNEGWAEDSHMCLRYIDRLDHSTTIARGLLHEEKITHDQYRALYQVDMDFITWRKENIKWVTQFVDDVKRGEMQQRYEESQRAQAEGLSQLLGAIFGTQIFTQEDEDEKN